VGLLKANAAARAEVLAVEKEAGHCRKPIRKGVEAILAKEWNIERPSWHGDECRKSMAFARLVCNEMKVFLLAEPDQNEGSLLAKREASKRRDIIAKCLLLFDGFLSVSRPEHKDLTPAIIAKARERAKKALAAWRMLKLSVAPKSRGSERHACDQPEFLQGMADFCEDWAEQLHQLGLKNDRRMKGDEGGQGQRPKMRTARQMGAVEWESRCAENKG
jgi:hypothetical protein